MLAMLVRAAIRLLLTNADEFFRPTTSKPRETKGGRAMAVIEMTRGRAIPRLTRPSWLLLSPTVRGFLSLFAFQVMLNVLVVAQERAAVMVAYGPSFTANVMLAGVSYLAVRQMVAGRSASLAVGYALGGGVGGVVGLYATKMLGL
jgi:hypothetical protein